MQFLAPLLALLALLVACGDAPGRAARPDVLLVTLDTLRADHLGAYGAPDGATPEIDAIARRGVVFERMLAASSRTAPSHATLFTSRWVRDHAIGYRNGATRLADEPTLAALLGDAGYETAAFVGNSMLRRRVGLDVGFFHYDDALPDSEANRPVFERIAEKTTARALDWIARPRPRRTPRFLWVHYNDPHGPYTPPAAFVPDVSGATEAPLPALDIQRGFDGIPAYQLFGDERDPRRYRARYAGEVRYLDASVGRLVRAFEQAAESGAVVAITADHGESLGEEGIYFSHGFGTTPNLAQVPLLLLAPGLPPGRVEGLVHHVDVMPTLLTLLDLPVPPGAAGLPLGPIARGEAALPADRALYVDVGAEVSVYRGETFLRARFGEDLGAAKQGSRRAYRWSDASRWVEADPAPELAALAEAYDRDRTPLRFAAAPDADDQARLRALGYLEPETPAGE